MVREPGDPLTVEASSLVERVGRRLRGRRRELEKTLAEVAAAAGVSVSYLSAVEKGANQPSLPVLARIVHALDLTIADVLRAEGQNWLSTGQLDAEPGARTLSHAGLQLRIVAVTADPDEAGDCPVPCVGHDVFVYVLSGALAVDVDGETYELRTGDSLDARSPIAISWRVPQRERSSSIWAAASSRGSG